MRKLHILQRNTACTVLLVMTFLLAGCAHTQGVSEELEDVTLQARQSMQNLSETEEEEAQDTKKQDAQENGRSEMVTVHVCGAVADPGVYTLPAGARACEALELAGGFAEGADREYLNLAAILEDGRQLRIPTEEETKNGLIQEEDDEKMYSGSEQDTRVHINSAEKEELMTLPGIGESKADSILEYRKEHGSFGSVDELKNITGIKDGVLDKIRDKITL